MKKNDWILIISVALYSFLFYQQTPGINFLIFNLALISGLVVKKNHLIKSTKWNVAAIGSLLSSMCIAYYGNGLSVTANMLSLSLLSALSFNRNTSLILSLLFSFYSASSSLVFIFLDWQSRKAGSSQPTFKKILLFVLPLLITLLFFIMYQQSNVLFMDFSKNINLNFISWNWIGFTAGGFILLYGFFYHRNIGWLATADENAPNHINALNKNTITLFGKKLSIQDEEFSGMLLFTLLNALLVIVNTLDLNFIFIDRKLPEGISYSQLVHQGTGMLILSILIAIAIILFYFRGALNFSERNKYIKLLAYLWVVQNALLLISTAFRNDLYVTEYGLTYKRIGVYFYLLLALIGLATTFIKIMCAKSNHYLFRINGWLFYFVLVCSCFVNWDLVITRFNVEKSKTYDKIFVLQLSDTNLPQLKQHEQQQKNAEVDEDVDIDYRRRLDKRLYFFLVHRQQLSWKSWYCDNTRIYNDLVHLNDQQQITSLELPGLGLQSLEALKLLDKVSQLDLHSNELWNIKEVFEFTRLTSLDLADNKLYTLQGIDILKELEHLNISQNHIHDYTPLLALKKLKSLKVAKEIDTSQYKLLTKNLPETIIIKV